MQFDFPQRTVILHLAYYGEPLAGKTTNLEHLARTLPVVGPSRMLARDGRLTFMPDLADPPRLGPMKVRFALHTLRSAFVYSRGRDIVHGADGVAVVFDSRKLQDLVREDLRSDLELHGRLLEDVPHVFQWNHRDAPDAIPIPELERALNPDGVPSFAAVANRGEGVRETFEALARRVLEKVKKENPL